MRGKQEELHIGKDGAPMITIPQGSFTMGSDEGPRNQRPEHVVWLSTYLIDQFEVTMNRYQKFLDETGHEPPPLWDDGASFEVGDRPAVGVNWGQRCRVLPMGRGTPSNRSRMGKSC